MSHFATTALRLFCVIGRDGVPLGLSYRQKIFGTSDTPFHTIPVVVDQMANSVLGQSRCEVVGPLVDGPHGKIATLRLPQLVRKGQAFSFEYVSDNLDYSQFPKAHPCCWLTVPEEAENARITVDFTNPQTRARDAQLVREELDPPYTVLERQLLPITTGKARIFCWTENVRHQRIGLSWEWA